MTASGDDGPRIPLGFPARATIPPAVGHITRFRARRALPVVGITITIIASAGALTACGGDSVDLPSGVVARVGDANITQVQLDRLLVQAEAGQGSGVSFPKKGTAEYTDLERQGLAQLVQQRIIEFEARKCGKACDVSNKEVATALDSVKQSEAAGDDKKFQQFLKDRKFTIEEARRQVRINLEQGKLESNVTRGVRFTAADAKKYYNDNRTQFHVAAGRTASHILVATKAEADRIALEATPQNFADLAKQYSTDTGTKDNGGNLGPLQKGTLVPEFEKVAYALKKGEISAPVKTQFGWHIIYVSNVTPARTIPFAEAKTGIIQQQLQTKRNEKLTEWGQKTLADWEKETVYANSDLAPQTDTTGATTAP